MHTRLTEYMNKGLLVVLLLMFTATLGASLYFSYTMLSLNSLIQEGTGDVTAALTLQDLLLNIREAESGQRGYIITLNKGYLKIYTEAVQNIPRDLAAIQGDSSLMRFQPQVQRLVSLTHQKVAELASTLKLRQDVSFAAAAAIINTTKDQQVMAEIGTLVQQIGSSSFQSIGPKLGQSKTDLHRSIVVAVILDVFVLAICAFIVRYFHQTIVRERAIEGAKNEFLSLASHQLRTPATSVKQYLGMVIGGYFGKLTPEQKDALDIAYQSNESEISIINNLLNIAKLSLEKIQITKKPVVVAALVKEVVDEYQPQIQVAKQTLAFTNRLKQRKALLDATYFKTVVENLVDNASKYSPEGAKISLELRRRAPQNLQLPKKTSEAFQLIVSDTGVGIKKRDLGKLFKKFSRVPGAASESVDGSGLGLYWVKQIVERHEGHIGVASRVGKGTRFTIELPLLPAPKK